MPREATSGARSSLRESRVPRDAAALVAAAARLRGALSDAEAARVGTAEILALLRAPRDADAPSPRRLRARCGWALDHGVVDALVEAMRAHADCVPLQTLAATCLADVAEAFVDENEAGGGSSDERLGDDEYPYPFDEKSGVVTNADLCVDAFEALSRSRRASNDASICSYDDASSSASLDALVAFAEANTRHVPFFRDENESSARRALVRSATIQTIPVNGTFRLCSNGDGKNENDGVSCGDRTLVLRGDVYVATRGDDDATIIARAREKKNKPALEAPLLSEQGHMSFEDSSEDPFFYEPEEERKKERRFVAGDALDPGSNPGENTPRSGASKAVYRAGAEGCVLVTLPLWALEANAVADAVDEGLLSFFGAAEEEKEEEQEELHGVEKENDCSSVEESRVEDDSSRVGALLGASLMEQKNHGVSSRRFSRSPHFRLARDGGADAVLHVALRCAGAGARTDAEYADGDEGMGSSSNRARARLASACFSFLERLASPPCEVAVLKSLGADGAMDRLVATKAAFSFSFSDETEINSETQRALAAADRALRALARCEQNMRAAFLLGAAEIVW